MTTGAVASLNDPKAAESLSRSSWIMFGLCFLANVCGGTVSTLMSVFLPVVVSDFPAEVKQEDFSYVSAYINALYVLGWASGGLSWGMIADRIGRVRALGLTTASYGLLAVLTGFAPGWELLVLFRFLTGFGVGGVLVISTTLLLEKLPQRFRGVLIGILSIGFPVGIFSAGLVNLLVQDWRQAFLIGVIPALAGLAIPWLIRESAEWKQAAGIKDKKTGRLPYSDTLLKGSIIFGSMLIGLWALFSWLPTWVQSIVTGSSGQQERSLSMMLLGTGGLLGGFLSGWISNALGVRRAMMLCFGGCVVMSVLLFGMNKTFSPVIYFETALLALFFGISQGLLAMYIPGLFPAASRAASTGFCFNAGRVLTAVAVFFVGALEAFFGGYGNTLLAFASIFVLGFIFIYFGRESSKAPAEGEPAMVSVDSRT